MPAAIPNPLHIMGIASYQYRGKIRINNLANRRPAHSKGIGPAGSGNASIRFNRCESNPADKSLVERDKACFRCS